MAKSNVSSDQFRINLDGSAISNDSVFRLCSHSQCRTRKVMGHRIIGLEFLSVFEDPHGLFIFMQFLEDGSKIVPCGDKPRCGCSNLLQDDSCVLETVSVNRKARKKQRGIDIIWICPDQLLREFL